MMYTFSIIGVCFSILISCLIILYIIVRCRTTKSDRFVRSFVCQFALFIHNKGNLPVRYSYGNITDYEFKMIRFELEILQPYIIKKSEKFFEIK